MIRSGSGLAAVLVALALVQGPPASAGTGDDPGPVVWNGQFEQSGGAARVGAEQKIVDERRSRPAKIRARPAVVSRTEQVPVCGSPAERFVGHSISCESVPCVLADGRHGERQFAVTRDVEVATGHTIGADRHGPVRCVPVSRAVSLDEAVRRQFRQVRLPGSVVRCDLAWTLVNYPTSFVAKQPWRQRDLGRVLGRRVSVEITPVAYRWSFGDGTPTEVGGAAMEHAYSERGAMPVSVETTYRVTYRVAGGRARVIPGTVGAPGPVSALDVFEARTELVAGPRG